MDQETLCNHLVNSSVNIFEIACKLVLRQIFNLRIINIDGPWDGGTDFTSYDKDGNKLLAAYQITTQKKTITNKAYANAKRAIERLKADRYYFLTSQSISETQARKVESEISTELGITCICFGAKHIAAFLIEESLVNNFLDEADYPLAREYSSSPDYIEMALHSYTLVSDDARSMKDGIYDDTMLFVLADGGAFDVKDIITRTISNLGLDESKRPYLQRRIDALFGKEFIQRSSDGNIIPDSVS